MRIEIPDEQGRPHNILDEPKWMDTVWMPRNGGRVVFRTRFADYTGRWVHHC
ncbi:MAG: multicopper oxidase domain-containing protein, partial [Acidobacteriota bacterium]|nr:multicopper oxidase domain-containing protein [Acidobacteriota bacterium]